MTLIQPAIHLLSINRLTIFIFHRVLPSTDCIFPDEPDAARFDEMMGWIGSWFNVLPLDVAVDALKSAKLPRRAAAITFDDGYADNHDVALPILQRHGLTATFFIATGFLDGGRMWNDTIIESVRHCQQSKLDLSPLNLGCHDIASSEQQRGVIQKIISQIKYHPLAKRLEITEHVAELAKVQPANNLMMTSQQVQAMRDAGMQIGAHTVSHPILARTDSKTAREEIANSKIVLESLLGEPVRIFAYPNGKHGADYNEEHIKIVRSLGFSAALTTNPGSARGHTDLYQLPRFTPWDRSRIKFGIRLLGNFRHSVPVRSDPL
jgi:peptidoglycan/xylan/chitin deacetylase (PgdA/CDA1 family)